MRVWVVNVFVLRVEEGGVGGLGVCVCCKGRGFVVVD